MFSPLSSCLIGDRGTSILLNLSLSPRRSDWLTLIVLVPRSIRAIGGLTLLTVAWSQWPLSGNFLSFWECQYHTLSPSEKGPLTNFRLDAMSFRISSACLAFKYALMASVLISLMILSASAGSFVNWPKVAFSHDMISGGRLPNASSRGVLPP